MTQDTIDSLRTSLDRAVEDIHRLATELSKTSRERDEARAHAIRLLDVLHPGLLKHETLCGVIDQIDNAVVGIRSSERRTGWDRAIKEAADVAENYPLALGKHIGESIAKRIRSLPFPPGEGDGGGIGGGEKDLGTITAPLTEPQNG